MKLLLRCAIPAAVLLSLAACDKEKAPASKGSAEGEILDGTVSDAMLPVDTVRSQAPLAPRSEGTEAAGSPDRERSRSVGSGEAKPAKPDEPAAEAEPDGAGDPVTPAAE